MKNGKLTYEWILTCVWFREVIFIEELFDLSNKIVQREMLK